MNKTNTNITVRGNKLTCSGPALVEGQKLPSFTLTAGDLSDLKSDAFKGKKLLVSVVPSLDTPVCQIETKRFNEEAASLGDDVVVLTVSVDLPFAQKRWCGAEGVERVVVASDYKYHTFGKAFGCFIEENALLCRAVFVANKEGTIRHIEYVPDISQEPDYAAAIAAAKA